VKHSHIVVVGAGIVGSATAYLLTRAGFRVTLVESRHRAGQVTSLANGAQLSYSYVEPLATPATLRKIPSMLLSRDSPLRLRPTGEWTQIVWGWRFLRACRADQVVLATRQLLELAFLSRDELDRAIERDQLSFRHARIGKLVVYDNRDAVRGAERQVSLQRTLGCEQEMLTAAQCLEREPALAHHEATLCGGVWTPGEAVGDAALLSNELVDHARRGGATLRFGASVVDFEVDGDQVRRVVCDDGGRLAADHVVIANGNGAVELARRLRMRLGIYPVKGYSITLPVVDRARAPSVSVTDAARKVVFAPLGNQLRVAGFAELVGNDLSIDSSRIASLVSSVGQVFPGACRLDVDPQPWAGLRPMTPTSLPVVGRTRWRNVLLNAGHGALGFTLAMGSARLVERHLSGVQTPTFKGV